MRNEILVRFQREIFLKYKQKYASVSEERASMHADLPARCQYMRIRIRFTVLLEEKLKRSLRCGYASLEIRFSFQIEFTKYKNDVSSPGTVVMLLWTDISNHLRTSRNDSQRSKAGAREVKMQKL